MSVSVTACSCSPPHLGSWDRSASCHSVYCILTSQTSGVNVDFPMHEPAFEYLSDNVECTRLDYAGPDGLTAPDADIHDALESETLTKGYLPIEFDDACSWWPV